MSTSGLSGEILLKTLWSQTSDGDLVFNSYCPMDTTTSERSVVGCAPLMHAQILYYWAGLGADLSLTLTADDAYQTETRGIYISGEYDPVYDYGVFSDINEQLAEISGDTDEDIAALCYACGVLVSADYASYATGAMMTTDVYGRAAFDSFRFVFSDSDPLFFNEIGGFPFYQIKITDAAWEVIQDNLLQGRVIAAASTSVSHALVMDGYNADDGTYHLNFGWGSSSVKQYSPECGCYVGTGWYTASEIDAMQIFCMGIDLYPVYDGEVFTVTDTREYGVGTLYRALEQAGGIQGEAVVDVSAELAGETISCSIALPVGLQHLTVNNLYGDIRIKTSSYWSDGVEYIRVALCSNQTLTIENFASDFAAVNSLGSAVAVAGRTELVINSLSGVAVANAAGTSAALYSDSSSEVTLIDGGLFAGYHSVPLTSGDDAVTAVFQAFDNFPAAGVSAFDGITGSVTGWALYSGDGDDLLRLTDNSAVLGGVYLAGGTNAVAVESGSYLYSFITASDDTLSVNLELKELSDVPLISLLDLVDSSSPEEITCTGVDALAAALADAVAVDVSQAESGVYTLISGVAAADASDLAFDLGDGLRLSLADNSKSGDYTLAWTQESLTLTVSGSEEPLIFTADAVISLGDGSGLENVTVDGCLLTVNVNRIDSGVSYQDVTLLNGGSLQASGTGFAVDNRIYYYCVVDSSLAGKTVGETVTVTVDGGEIQAVYGVNAFVSSAAAKAAAPDAQLVIAAETVEGNYYGGCAAKISGGSVARTTYGGTLCQSGEIAAADSSLSITGGTFSSMVVGGHRVSVTAGDSAAVTAGKSALTVSGGGFSDSRGYLVAAGYLINKGVSASLSVAEAELSLSGVNIRKYAFGGAFADNGTAAVEMVNVSVTSGTYDSLFAGGWAQNNGLVTVTSAAVAVTGGSIRNLYAGGTDGGAGNAATMENVEITISGGAVQNLFLNGKYSRDTVGTATVNITGNCEISWIEGLCHSLSAVSAAAKTVLNIGADLKVEDILHVDEWNLTEAGVLLDFGSGTADLDGTAEAAVTSVIDFQIGGGELGDGWTAVAAGSFEGLTGDSIKIDGVAAAYDSSAATWTAGGYQVRLASYQDTRKALIVTEITA